jgi:cyclopropane-fatty-acyl-phospholipid synthase
MWYMRLFETSRAPDWLIRGVLRLTLARTLKLHHRVSLDQRSAEKRAVLQKFRLSPIAIHTDDPNGQHKVPADFFQLALGQRPKYSCCYWPKHTPTLDEAKEAMLRLTCQHRLVAAARRDAVCAHL